MMRGSLAHPLISSEKVSFQNGKTGMDLDYQIGNYLGCTEKKKPSKLLLNEDVKKTNGLLSVFD